MKHRGWGQSQRPSASPVIVTWSWLMLITTYVVRQDEARNGARRPDRFSQKVQNSSVRLSVKKNRIRLAVVLSTARQIQSKSTEFVWPSFARPQSGRHQWSTVRCFRNGALRPTVLLTYLPCRWRLDGGSREMRRRKILHNRQ
jgi:hypothetical protein